MQNNAEHQYLEIMRDILENGVERDDRTGTGTISKFGVMIKHDYSEGFPLLTSKKIHVKSIIHELLWILKGDTNIKYLQENGVRIWNEWADENGNLGPVYGKQMRDCGGVDQLKEVIKSLKENPWSRRHIISLWHPPDIPKMALPPCFTEDMFIQTKTGFKKIIDISLEDKVLTHSGRYSKINKIFKTKYNGNLLNIKAVYCLPIKCTKNHPFLIKDKGWVEAQDINVGDFLAIKTSKRNNIPEFEREKYINFNKKSKKLIYKKEKFILSQDELFFIGYFVGDGWFTHPHSKDSARRNKIGISIADKDVEKLLPLFNKTVNKFYESKRSGRSGGFEANTAKLTPILKEFGRGASNKKIPKWLLEADNEVIISFLNGYYKADGCIRNKRRRATTVSPQLALGIQKLELKLKNSCSITSYHGSDTKNILGRICNVKKQYCFESSPNPPKKLVLFEEDYIWVKIRKIEQINNFDNYVYNLSVENDHTYTCNNIITHNCHGNIVQFYVREIDNKKYLDLATYQRSADAFLGLPFNISSYSFLLYMIAQQVDMIPGTLSYFIGDCHIYKNHIEQIKEQLNRKPFKLPSLKLNKKKSIDDYTFDDFEIIDYQHHPAIKAEVSV